MSPRKTVKKPTRKAAPARKAAKKAVKKASTARPKRRTAATGLKVRMYRVGFGDFFLLTIPTKAGDKFIMIDCGVFKGTSGTGDIGSIEEAVEDMFQHTGGELSLVIMTHRHADHIAGINRAAETFRKMKAGLVWMPYWEQLNEAKGSAHNLQFQIEQLAMQLALQFRGREDDDARMALDMLWDATGIDFNAAPAKPRKLSGNALALDILKNHLGENGKKVRYLAAGQEAELPAELKGLSATILGPPPREAEVFMKLEDLKVGVGQYLDSTMNADGSIRPFPQQWEAEPARDYPQADPLGNPIDYERIRNEVATAQPDMLVEAAKKIDKFLNNQSLVILFEFGGKSMLFVGDAQAGNWEHWLYEAEGPSKDPTKLGNLSDGSSEILRNIDFYKVGHHGSTNSTPIQVVEALGSGRTKKGLVAMCSTEPAVYGNPDKGTEVPRVPLIDALKDECDMIRSDAFAITTSEGVIKAAPNVGRLPKPKSGKLESGKLYVEYTF